MTTYKNVADLSTTKSRRLTSGSLGLCDVYTEHLKILFDRLAPLLTREIWYSTRGISRIWCSTISVPIYYCTSTPNSLRIEIFFYVLTPTNGTPAHGGSAMLTTPALMLFVKVKPYPTPVSSRAQPNTVAFAMLTSHHIRTTNKLPVQPIYLLTTCFSYYNAHRPLVLP
jgi:hypothetical protein